MILSWYYGLFGNNIPHLRCEDKYPSASVSCDGFIAQSNETKGDIKVIMIRYILIWASASLDVLMTK